MKPEDILSAIGDVDDAFIRKARRKSLMTAILVFAAIVLVSCAVLLAQMPEHNLLLRYDPDGSVNTGYVEPEAVVHNKWTSMEYTSYVGGQPVATARFRRHFLTGYDITRTEHDHATQIIGASSDTLWPQDYLDSRHYANLYLSTMFSTDLIDRIHRIYINAEVAYGTGRQQLNCIELEYSERSNQILRQTLLENGGTPEETVTRSRGYSYHYGQLTGWMEWDSEGVLLSYAEYTYDGNIQTVSTYLADGTLTGTRVSKYVFGDIRWREYYGPDGVLTGREVYRYRPWELLLSLEGLVALIIVCSLAATIAFAIWDDRLLPGIRLVSASTSTTETEISLLIREARELKAQIRELSDKLPQTGSEPPTDEIRQLTGQLEQLDHLLEMLLHLTEDRN